MQFLIKIKCNDFLREGLTIKFEMRNIILIHHIYLAFRHSHSYTNKP